MEADYYDPIAPLTTDLSRSYRPEYNYFAGMYDVYPDPSRPGVVYATSGKMEDGVSFDAVNMVRYVGKTLDVDVPHDVGLKGKITVPTSIDVSSGAAVTVRQGTALTLGRTADIRVDFGGELVVEDAAVFNMGWHSALRSYGLLDVNGASANPVILRRAGLRVPTVEAPDILFVPIRGDGGKRREGLNMQSPTVS